MKTMSTKAAIAGWAVIIAVLLATCGESDSDKRKKAAAFDALPFDQKVMSLSSNITEVRGDESHDDLMVFYNKTAIWDGNNWAWNFFGTAKTVLSKVNTLDPAVKYKRVVFMVHYPTRDSLGNEGSALGMKAFYTMAALDGAKWEKMWESDIADLAGDLQFKRDGLSLAAEYCKDKKDTARIFCKKVLMQMVKRY